MLQSEYGWIFTLFWPIRARKTWYLLVGYILHTNFKILNHLYFRRLMGRKCQLLESRMVKNASSWLTAFSSAASQFNRVRLKINLHWTTEVRNFTRLLHSTLSWSVLAHFVVPAAIRWWKSAQWVTLPRITAVRNITKSAKILTPNSLVCGRCTFTSSSQKVTVLRKTTRWQSWRRWTALSWTGSWDRCCTSWILCELTDVHTFLILYKRC